MPESQEEREGEKIAEPVTEERKSKPVEESNQSNNKEETYHKGNKLPFLLGVLLVILAAIGLGAFFVDHNNFGPRFIGNNHTRITRDYGNMGFGNMGRPGMMGGYRVFQNRIIGKVTGVNGKTFTMDVSGTSYNVQINDTTRFPINSANTVKAEDTVLVWGQKDNNGVVQATQISVNP
ncbi:MAG: DUF5666 domain-containing protein [Patescibacteria group bacterium]|jgi:hypothetical protein|nr:DUF5666 domain-containing protein [Patescibacteria group bacterium]